MTIDVASHQVSNFNLKGDIVIYGKNDEEFGYGMAEPADVNRDGYLDLVITAKGEDDLGDHPAGHQPSIWIYPGDIDGYHTTTPIQVSYPGELNNCSGCAPAVDGHFLVKIVETIDYDGDGKYEIVSTAWGDYDDEGAAEARSKNGSVYVYTHDPVGGNHNISKLSGRNNAANSYFGYSMSQLSTMITMVYRT